MVISDKGIGIIKEFEGFRSSAYKCSAGVWTVGYGSTVINGDKVKACDKVSREEAERLLRVEANRLAGELKKIILVPLNQNQIDALISFTYNIGLSAFSKSTMLKLINAKEFNAASFQFDRWNKANGRVLPGLVARRNKEEELFTSSKN